MIAEVQYQGSFWTVPAQVLVLDDCRGPNAFAVNGEPTILYGVRFFQQMLARNGDFAVIGILAHEWAHRLQMTYGWETRPVRNMELEADAFAGFFLGLAKGWAWNFINQFYQNTFDLGDFAFNDPVHHGTPQQRLAMARLGFDTGAQSLFTGRRYSWIELHSVFTGMIRTFQSDPRLMDELLATPPKNVTGTSSDRRALYPR